VNRSIAIFMSFATLTLVVGCTDNAEPTTDEIVAQVLADIPESERPKREEVIQMVEKIVQEHGRAKAAQLVKEAHNRAREAQRIETAIGDIRCFVVGSSAFFAMKNRYPKSLEELVKTSAKERRPCIDPRTPLIDPWGTPYNFSIGDDESVTVKSAGPDTKFGTADDIMLRQ